MTTTSIIVTALPVILFVHLISTQSLANLNITMYESNVADDHTDHAERMSRRSRREPAIWGEPAPDYSGVQLNDYVHFLNALIFVDSKITNHYGYNVAKVKSDVMKLIQEANNYFYQINVRIIVVDILQTYRNDLSLYSFEEYRNRRMSKLPIHDFAVLISHRYAGGLAFVNGMCTAKNVMLCGFYPHDPAAMGGIFFHEVAHLLGVAHRNATDPVDVPNCYCSGIQITAISGCLKIPGYDHDCTLQQMVNMLEKNRCLRHIKITSFFFTQHTVEKSLPLCGNGIIEGKEECDCGLYKLCYNWNCRADQCLQIVKTWQMYACGCMVTVLAVTAMISCIIRRLLCHSTLSNDTYDSHHSSSSCLLQFLTNLKSMIGPRNRHFWHRAGSNYGQSLRLTGNDTTLAKHHFIGIPNKADSNSMTVLIAPLGNKDIRLVRKSTITRPTKPPPPPPAFSSRSAFDKALLSMHTSVPLSPLEKRLPPPLPIKPSNLPLKMIITGNDGTYEMPNTVRRRLSSTIQTNALDCCSQPSEQHFMDYYDSISRKFDDDFDDDFDGDCDRHEQQSIQYAVIIPVKNRLWGQERKSVKSIPLHHLYHDVRKPSIYKKSISSNESKNQPYPSDDTGSTGLSEEDERIVSVTDIVRKFNGGKL